VLLTGWRRQFFRSASKRFRVARQQKNFGAQFGECGSRCAAYSLGSATDNGALPGKGLLHAVKLARLARLVSCFLFLVAIERPHPFGYNRILLFFKFLQMDI
jgi:hypothetical protein